MNTPLQTAVLSNITKRQQNSLYALQNKVEKDRGPFATTRVSNAQMQAMQAAYNAAKASGIPLPPETVAAAAKLGLK